MKFFNLFPRRNKTKPPRSVRAKFVTFDIVNMSETKCKIIQHYNYTVQSVVNDYNRGLISYDKYCIIIDAQKRILKRIMEAIQ